MGCTSSLSGILTIWHNNPLGIEKMPISASEGIKKRDVYKRQEVYSVMYCVPIKRKNIEMIYLMVIK